MTTARDIVNGAFFRLDIIDANEQPAPADAALALAALNDMLADWRSKSIDIDASPLALNDTLPLDTMHDQGVKAMLATRISGDFSEPVPAGVAFDALSGWQGIVGQYWLQDPMRVDPALAYMPSARIRTR